MLRPPRPFFVALVFSVALAGCFGIIREPARHFYILHVKASPASDAPRLSGLVRVRDLDAETAYDRTQMVVRKSPFELGYRPRDTWAVRPGRMLSDLLARALAEHGAFDGVTRELSERRPDYLLSGDLHALEVEQSGRLWQARLAITLQITEMDTGDVLWSGHYDEREPCAAHDYGAAVEALSQALGRVTQAMLQGLHALAKKPVPPQKRATVPATAEPPRTHATPR